MLYATNNKSSIVDSGMWAALITLWDRACSSCEIVGKSGIIQVKSYFVIFYFSNHKPLEWTNALCAAQGSSLLYYITVVKKKRKKKKN